MMLNDIDVFFPHAVPKTVRCSVSKHSYYVHMEIGISKIWDTEDVTGSSEFNSYV